MTERDKELYRKWAMTSIVKPYPEYAIDFALTYAKDEAVRFAEWLQKGRWKYYGNAQGKWKRPLTPTHTTDQLYQQFKEQEEI